MELSPGCAHFELSNASGFPAGVVLPALLLKTITVAEDIDLCYGAREFLGKDAEAGKRETSKLSIRAVIHVETDAEARMKRNRQSQTGRTPLQLLCERRACGGGVAS